MSYRRLGGKLSEAVLSEICHSFFHVAVRAALVDFVSASETLSSSQAFSNFRLGSFIKQRSHECITTLAIAGTPGDRWTAAAVFVLFVAQPGGGWWGQCAEVQHKPKHT